MSEARKKILCIEDDRETARLVAEALSDRGFDVVIAHDGYVGLIAVLRKITDIVLCETSLPKISGFELLECLNAIRFHGTPFVFLTASSDRHDELLARSLGADDYVTKPIDFDILAAIIGARLASGVSRIEILARQPWLNAPPGQALPRRARDRASSKRTVRGQIVELKDAPTVGFHLGDAKPIAEATARDKIETKAAMDTLIKR